MSIRWISHVWQKSPYKGEHLLLHLALADFANDEGECFPSVRTLALKARCSEQWVRQGIRKMIDHDLIEIVERGLGRGNVNRYRLKGVSKKGESDFGISAKGVSLSTENPKSDDSLSIYQNHHEPSIHRPSFDSFWNAYPKKVGKGLALKAFVKIMTSKEAPTLDDLLEGIERYKKTISDSKYIAHPTTWLNGHRWLDEISTSADPSARLVVSPAISNAQSFGASQALIGSTEQELLESIEHYKADEHQAALEAYLNRIKR